MALLNVLADETESRVVRRRSELVANCMASRLLEEVAVARGRLVIAHRFPFFCSAPKLAFAPGLLRTRLTLAFSFFPENRNH